jgi:hypothetical protein
MRLRRCVLLALLASGIAAPAAVGATYTFPVSVYPTPGTRVAPLGAQIVFRGIAPLEIGPVTVTGSNTGNHPGTLAGDSDGEGASFIPATPFAPGETVTVRTTLNVIGGRDGAFRFTVATPAGPLPIEHVFVTKRHFGDVSHFNSAPTLEPARIRILKRSSHTAPGDIFLAPQRGPLQNGPELLDASGNLLWFDPLPPQTWAANFRVQTYLGKPVLTWWQGSESFGSGLGVDMIADSTYTVLKRISAADGLSADLHEFQLTPHGTALITAYYPVYWDTRAAKGRIMRRIVFDGVVQEIDVATGLLEFEWDSLDHVPLGDSHSFEPARTQPYDYFHINSVQPDTDGNLIVSSRDTWTIYKVDRMTGAVIWRLGGRESTFKLGPGTSTAWQHDAVMHPGNLLSVFDNGGGPPRVQPHSEALLIRLDVIHHRATLVRQFSHSPELNANYEGDAETLPGGDLFTGWGQQPYFTEFDAHGRTVFDARFIDRTTSYRAFRYPWTGIPDTPPGVAARRRGKTTLVWASWNGATVVHAWRALAGSRRSRLRPARVFAKRSFETATSLAAHPAYLEIEALDAAGHVLRTSPPVKVGR